MTKSTGQKILVALFLVGLALSSYLRPAAAAPPAMPLVSQGVPAYASDNNSQAGLANNSDYDDLWRSFRTPSTSQPSWLAYNLSGKSLGQIAVTWYNPQYGYEIAATGGTPYNLPQNYTIDVNASTSSTVPTSGWVTKVTVTNNDYHSRTAYINMSGYNWIRINCTSILGSYENEDIAVNMDVFDARNGTQDTWMFFGDSITAGGMAQTGTTFSQSVHAGAGAFYPSQENGGVAGWKTGDLVNNIGKFLGVTSAHYVTLSLGTNDVNSYAGDTASINNAYNNLVSLANTVIASGRVPIIPHMPWARTAPIQANAPVLNAMIDQLCASNRNIILGPDLYGYFNANQGLIGSDNLHPSTPDGFQAYRNFWASWALSTIYGANTGTVNNGTYKIISRNSGLALDAYGLGTADGTQIGQYAYNGGNNQRWTVTSLGGGLYSIFNVNANKPLDAANSGGSGTFVDLWTSYSSINQKWFFTPTDSGYFRITPAYSAGLALDVYGAATGNYNPSAGNNGRVQVYNWSGAYNQQWSFQAP